MIIVKNSDNLRDMMVAGTLAARTLQFAGETLKSGISTWELDRAIGAFIEKNGGKSSSLGYRGFKGNCCISVNEELIHGVPSKKKVIKDGDIVSVDICVNINGYHGDNTKTFAVGEISPEARRLLEVTEQSLYEGIKMARAGNRIGDIGYAIQSYTESRGYYVVKPYIGHGIGKNMHEDPEVPNFGKPGRGVRLVPGMTIAIEPMINSTTAEIYTKDDDWTIVEANNNLCAHFEHTVAVTDGEPLIMTLLPDL